MSEEYKPLNLVLTVAETAPSSLSAPYNLRLTAFNYIPEANIADYINDIDYTYEINAVFSNNNIDTAEIDVLLDVPSVEVVSHFDINHIVSVSLGLNLQLKTAIACLSVAEIPWAKPISRVSNEALFYDQGLVISSQVDIWHEQAGSLTRVIRSIHEQATGLSSDAYMIWEEGDKRFIHQRYLHEETIKLHHNRESVWQEMIRRRKTFTYSHEVAQVFEHRFSFEWDKSLEIVTKSDLPWDQAKACLLYTSPSPRD